MLTLGTHRYGKPRCVFMSWFSVQLLFGQGWDLGLVLFPAAGPEAAPMEPHKQV